MLRPVLLSSLAVPALAETTTAKPGKDTINPLQRLDQKTDEIMKGLDEKQTQQFAAIRTSYGAISAVYDVRDSLGRAVESCGRANPDLAQTLTSRYQDWKNAVLPVARKGENRLDKMILLQNFTRPSQVRAYLKIFSDAVAFKNQEFKEVPVSSKDACKTLSKNMDDSEKVMARLITETLGLDKETTSEPVIDKTKAD
jgi:hypothetical protein